MSSTPIIYPIFDECKNYTLDLYWKEQFTKFACNKFPQGVRYDSNHGNIILKLEGKKTEVIALDTKDAVKTFQTMMSILKTKLNMRSTRDIKIQKEEMEEIMKKRVMDLNCEYKKIRPRYLKEQLVMDYTISLKKEYGLSPIELKKLNSTISLGFQFKALTPEDVDYSNGIINNIRGLEFDPETRKFKIPEYPTVSSSRTEKVSTANRFYALLDRFLRDNNARVKKYI